MAEDTKGIDYPPRRLLQVTIEVSVSVVPTQRRRQTTAAR